MTIPRRSSRRAYSRVSSGAAGSAGTEQDASQPTTDLQEPLAPNNVESPEGALEQSPPSSSDPPPLLAEDDDDEEEDEKDMITVIVLDSAQTRFQVSANPDWTVMKFKKMGVAVHKVPAPSQRLVFRGKLLGDDATLRHFGITVNDTIVHLFPKPNVVVTGGTENSSTPEEEAESNNTGAGGGGGAHVPRIVLDAEEAERRSQILVLASDEVFEAQHRVKLLSFLLLIICTMELFTLFGIYMGVPEENGEDDTPPGDPIDPTDYGGGSDSGQMRPWQNSDYADLAISSFGFYVAMLGIKATTENTLRLAKQYMACLFVVGCAWNAFYFYVQVQAEKDATTPENQNNNDDDAAPAPSQEISNTDIYTGAFFVTLFPILVWVLCCIRAWQFHELLLEAEREAEERTRSELELDEEEAGAVGLSNNNNVIDEQELVLQDENARIT